MGCRKERDAPMPWGRSVKQEARTRVGEVLIYLMTSGYDGCLYGWADIAFGTGITRPWLDSVQNGRVTDPPASKVLLIADFFHVDPGLLLRAIMDESLPLAPSLISQLSQDEAKKRFVFLKMKMEHDRIMQRLAEIDRRIGPKKVARLRRESEESARVRDQARDEERRDWTAEQHEEARRASGQEWAEREGFPVNMTTEEVEDWSQAHRLRYLEDVEKGIEP